MASAIRNGHRDTIMGEFKYELTNSQIGDLLSWLRLTRYGLTNIIQHQ